MTMNNNVIRHPSDLKTIPFKKIPRVIILDCNDLDDRLETDRLNGCMEVLHHMAYEADDDKSNYRFFAIERKVLKYDDGSKQVLLSRHDVGRAKFETVQVTSPSHYLSLIRKQFTVPEDGRYFMIKMRRTVQVVHQYGQFVTKVRRLPFSQFYEVVTNVRFGNQYRIKKIRKIDCFADAFKHMTYNDEPIMLITQDGEIGPLPNDTLRYPEYVLTYGNFR